MINNNEMQLTTITIITTTAITHTTTNTTATTVSVVTSSSVSVTTPSTVQITSSQKKNSAGVYMHGKDDALMYHTYMYICIS